jgi:hypothetical protein
MEDKIQEKVSAPGLYGFLTKGFFLPGPAPAKALMAALFPR